MSNNTIRKKLSDSHYQPSKAEMEKEYDMPKLLKEDVRKLFFKPKDIGRKIG